MGTKGLHLWGQGDANACNPTAFVNGIPNWANTLGPGGAPVPCPSVNLAFPSGRTCTVITSTGSILQFPSGRNNCNLSYDNQIQTNSASWYNGLQVSFMLTSCFDWGPVALQHLLLFSGTLLLMKFHDEDRTWVLYAGFFVFGLGLWDKAIFVWMLTGLVIAVSFVYPRQIVRYMSFRRAALSTLCLMLGPFH